MTPDQISRELLDEVPDLLHVDTPLEDAVRRLVEHDLPALPVIGADERLCGLFGEREFFAAAFPGYVGELKYAGFVKHGLDSVLELRDTCRSEPVSKHMNTEHVDVGPDFSDVEVAEVFLHHRVLIIPVVDDGRVVGVIGRHGFFTALAARLLGS